jgi:hypothetical protein
MADFEPKYTAGFSYEHKEYGYTIGYYSEVFRNEYEDEEILDTEVCIEPDNSNN